MLKIYILCKMGEIYNSNGQSIILDEYNESKNNTCFK